MPEPLSFHNLTHLGDCIFDSILLNALAPRPILYLTHPKNQPHVREFFGPHVTLTDYMPEGAREIWITNTLVGRPAAGLRPGLPPKFYPACRPHPEPHFYNQVYLDHFRGICTAVNVPCPFDHRDQICHHQPELDTGEGYDWDWLIVNSECLSGQLECWGENLLALIVRSLPGRVITTHPVPGVPCTRDVAPRMWDIARLAGRCRIVAGINTGPLLACLTAPMLRKVQRLVAVDLLHGFEYGGKSLWCRNLDEFAHATSALSRQLEIQ